MAYLALLSQYSQVVLEIQDHYAKQTYRNRCYVRGANRVQLLSVPIQKASGKVLTRDVKTEDGVAWRNHHWRTIQSAYGKAPFFDFFAQNFHDILYQKSQFLVDLTTAILTECLEILQIPPLNLTASQSYQKTPPDSVTDARNTLIPSQSPVGPDFFRPIPYTQVFGKDFVPNLSVIDLLFCEGSQANSIIRRSFEFPG